jgi:HD-GYP domain-containing protein (c-di-GMP phosphodiesterase class II)
VAPWRIVLSGISPKLEGLQWESSNALRIGRTPNQEICLSDPSISRQHAEVFAGPQGWAVRDLGSTGGTFVNGLQVQQTPRKLRHLDVLQCGTLALKVMALEEEFRSAVPASVSPQQIKRTGTIVRVQAVAQRSWEQGLEQLAVHDDQRLRQGKHFLTLLRAGYHLSRIASLDELLQSLLDDTVAVLSAQRGAIVLADPVTGVLHQRVVFLLQGEANGSKCYSTTLAERCFRSGESLLCRDVHADAGLKGAPSVARGGMASIICALLRSPRRRLGILHLDRGPAQPQFTAEDFHLADAIAASVSVGIESAQLVEGQRDVFLQGITALTQRAVELRDPSAGDHAQKVTAYALRLAEELRLSAEEYRHLQIGAPLHDIGRLGLEASVFRKPGQLTADEFEHIKSHTVRGAALAETVAELAPAVPIIRSHHEHWDGSGYPDGLAGEQIPRLARIVAVADAFDTMTSHQPYRAALSVEEAFAALREKAGSQFDPACVQAFLRVRPQVEAALGQQQPLAEKLEPVAESQPSV